MTDPLAEFEAAQARLRAMVAEARDNTSRAERVADDARSAQATSRSPRGELTVTSRAGGVVTGIQFTEAALELSPQALAQLTVTTIAQAQHAAAMRFAETAAGEFGSDSAIANTLKADAERAFPSPGGEMRY